MKKLNKILLVDDDEINNFITETLLNEMAIAHQVVTLTNGRLALDYILQCYQVEQSSGPQLLILDHYMPVMDGMEFMEAFEKLKLPDKGTIIVLLLASSTNPADLARFAQLGVQEFTDKPLSEQRVWEAYQKYWQLGEH